MKKITLAKSEAITYKVHFAKRILLFNFALVITVITLFNRLSSAQNPSYFTIGLTVVVTVLYAFVLIRVLLNLIRITTHRIYITNKRVIIIKGYLFKRIQEIPLTDITGIYFRIRFLDKKLGVSNLKFIDNKHKSYVIRGVTYGSYIAELLSAHLMKKHLKK
jgi:membrane protein YdbS with pleckstrin-like domain